MTKAETIADRVEEWRKMAEIPAAEFAYKIRISPSTYQRRLNCPYQFTIAELERIEKLTRLQLLN